MWRCVALCCFALLAVGQDQRGLPAKYEKDIEAAPRSSLAHFRLAELRFHQHDYQAAANEFREALAGDLQPPWVEVWSRIGLGKIFDLSGQRERAVNAYRMARVTNDNTRGALDEAEVLTLIPYSLK